MSARNVVARYILEGRPGTLKPSPVAVSILQGRGTK